LNYHIKTSKKCILSRSDNEICFNHVCIGCDKVFTTKNKLNIHETLCNSIIKVQTYELNVIKLNDTIKNSKIEIDSLLTQNTKITTKLEELEIDLEYKDGVISEKDTLIAELYAKIEIYKEFSDSYSARSTSTNNMSNMSNSNNTTVNNVNNIIVSSLDIMEDPSKLNRLIEEHYSTDYFIEGQIGVAKFSNDHLITNAKGDKLYICTDASRNSFKYKNSKGEIIKDPQCSKLACNLLDNGLKDMARKHSNALLARDHDFTNVTSKFFEIDDMCKDTKRFCKHLGSLVVV
jgi:hypothetical protein